MTESLSDINTLRDVEAVMYQYAEAYRKIKKLRKQLEQQSTRAPSKK